MHWQAALAGLPSIRCSGPHVPSALRLWLWRAGDNSSLDAVNFSRVTNSTVINALVRILTQVRPSMPSTLGYRTYSYVDTH